MSMSALLRAFCDAVEQRNGAVFADLFTEDAVYHDAFYGAFAGRAKIAEMIDDWFYRTNPFPLGHAYAGQRRRDALCALHLQLSLDTTRGRGTRAMFEGVAIMKLRDGRIAEYHEFANTATGFVDMHFAPERIANCAPRQAAALKARPETKRHLDG